MVWMTLPWRGQSGANPSLKGRIPCYTGNLQGILSVSAFAPDSEVEKEQNSQWFANKFPTHRNRELIRDLSGN